MLKYNVYILYNMHFLFCRNKSAGYFWTSLCFIYMQSNFPKAHLDTLENRPHEVPKIRLFP